MRLRNDVVKRQSQSSYFLPSKLSKKNYYWYSREFIAGLHLDSTMISPVGNVTHTKMRQCKSGLPDTAIFLYEIRYRPVKSWWNQGEARQQIRLRRLKYLYNFD